MSADENFIYVSSDGKAWEKRQFQSATDAATMIVYSEYNAEFVILKSYRNSVVYSYDLVTFHERPFLDTSSISNRTFYFYETTYGNGTFVTVAHSEYNGTRIYYSYDGLTWYNFNLGASVSANAYKHVVYKNGYFLVSGTRTTFWYSYFIRITDPTYWTEKSLSDIVKDWEFSFSKDKTIAGFNSDGFLYADTFINTTWTVGSFPYSSDKFELSKVAYGNETYISVSINAPLGKQLIVSSNGVDWKYRKFFNTDLKGIVFGNNKFVIISKGDNSQSCYIILSPDGNNWNRIAMPFQANKILYF